MAARKQLWHPDETKKKIQTSQLINRLQKHALSDEDIMSASQVSAAFGLLKKVVPDVQPIDPATGNAGVNVTLTVTIGDDDS